MACHRCGSRWRVSAGDPRAGPHRASYTCTRHLSETVAWIEQTGHAAQLTDTHPPRRQTP